LAVEGGDKLGGAAPLPPQRPLPEEQIPFPKVGFWGRGLGWGVKQNKLTAIISKIIFHFPGLSLRIEYPQKPPKNEFIPSQKEIRLLFQHPGMILAYFKTLLVR
jgi:hypothetical protein